MVFVNVQLDLSTLINVLLNAQLNLVQSEDNVLHAQINVHLVKVPQQHVQVVWMVLHLIQLLEHAI